MEGIMRTHSVRSAQEDYEILESQSGEIALKFHRVSLYEELQQLRGESQVNYLVVGSALIEVVRYRTQRIGLGGQSESRQVEGV
jgi:hypothetical protein